MGSSKAVPVTTQHPCDNPGIRLRDKASSVEIVLSIRKRSLSLTYKQQFTLPGSQEHQH
jgi:hypothetical protein